MARTLRTARAASAFAMPRVAHKRDDYDTRTGRATRAAKHSVKGLLERPAFIEDPETGHLVRVWKRSEERGFTQADIKGALTRARAVEVAELLGTIPLGAIKNAIYNGWIIKDEFGAFYHVTRKAALELDLAKKDRNGVAIKFHPNMKKWSERPGQETALCEPQLNPLLPKVTFRVNDEN